MNHNAARQCSETAGETAEENVRLASTISAAKRRLVTAALYIAAHEDWAGDDSAQAHAMFKAALTDLMAIAAAPFQVEPWMGGSGRLDGKYARILLAALEVASTYRDRPGDDTDGPSAALQRAKDLLNEALDDYIFTAIPRR